MMMKKVLMGVMLSLLIGNGYAGFSKEEVSDCSVNNDTFSSQLFPVKRIRVGTTVVFSDTMKNSGNTPLGLISQESKVITIQKHIGAYLETKTNKAADNGGDFRFTDWINDKKGIVYPQEEGIIMTAMNKFVIPTKGELEGIHGKNLVNMNKDFMLKYYYGYKTVVNGQRVGELKRYLGCQPYQVSWCGDGVLDKEAEICDPKDPKKQGWEMGQCPNTCESTTLNQRNPFGVKPSK